MIDELEHERLKDRVSELEQFCARVADFFQVLAEDDPDGPGVLDDATRWRKAHEAARARRKRERGR